MGWLGRWWWALLLAMVVVLRAALPSILRGQIETRASAALRATVTVGDVDLSLAQGKIALHDVTVRASSAPPDTEPLVSWKRLGVDLRWWPLFGKIVRFEAIELDEPHVALDRLQSGDINLSALVPTSDPAPGDGTPAPPSAWKIGVDYLGLHRGGIQFRDFLIPGAEPLALSLESIEVRDVALAPDVYGRPGDLKVTVRLDEGSLRTRARITPRADGTALDLTVNARKLPVHRSRIYVPDVAWSDLTGSLSLALRYRLETGGRNELSGKIGLDDLTVWVAGLDEPALTWKSLGVDLDRIDLAGHDVRVREVTVVGATVPVRPQGPQVVPLLTAAKVAKEAAQQQAERRQVAAASTASPEPGGPAVPWSWAVAAIALRDGHARLLSDRPTLDVGVDSTLKGLASALSAEMPVTLDLRVGDGTLGIDGRLRIEPLGFAGRVTSSRLSVPELLDVSGAMPAGVVQVGRLDTALDVSVGSMAPTAGDVEMSGTVTVSEPWIAAADPKDFGAGAQSITVVIDKVTAPGALAKTPATSPLTVALSSVAIDTPYARLNRTAEGMILPAFTNPPAHAASAPATAASSEALAPRVAIERVTVTKGRVDLLDRTVKPYYWTALTPIDASLDRVRTPGLEIGAVKLRAQTGAKGIIEVSGGLTKKSDLALVVKGLDLRPFNPYVTAASPYSVSKGALFVTTKVGIDGSRYDTTTALTLADFDLASRTGQHVVLEQLGIPLTVAIALLRDLQGNIDITIPVQVDEKGSEVGLGTVVSGALLRALVGALTSPLKLVGAVLPTGGGGGSLAPEPVRFEAGVSVLSPAGQEQVGHLASFVAERPGLAVVLSAPPTAADVRGLREQALLQKLGPRTGIVGTLRNVGARGRIIEALDARSRGDEGSLEPEDQQALDAYLKDVADPSAAQLAQLGQARLGLVERTLRDDYGIGAEQVTRAEHVSAELVEGDPGVRVELGTVRR